MSLFRPIRPDLRRAAIAHLAVTGPTGLRAFQRMRQGAGLLRGGSCGNDAVLADFKIGPGVFASDNMAGVTNVAAARHQAISS